MAEYSLSRLVALLLDCSILGVSNDWNIRNGGYQRHISGGHFLLLLCTVCRCILSMSHHVQVLNCALVVTQKTEYDSSGFQIDTVKNVLFGHKVCLL